MVPEGCGEPQLRGEASGLRGAARGAALRVEGSLRVAARGRSKGSGVGLGEPAESFLRPLGSVLGRRRGVQGLVTRPEGPNDEKRFLGALKSKSAFRGGGGTESGTDLLRLDF